MKNLRWCSKASDIDITQRRSRKSQWSSPCMHGSTEAMCVKLKHVISVLARQKGAKSAFRVPKCPECPESRVPIQSKLNECICTLNPRRKPHLEETPRWFWWPPARFFFPQKKTPFSARQKGAKLVPKGCQKVFSRAPIFFLAHAKTVFFSAPKSTPKSFSSAHAKLGFRAR